MKIIPYIVFVLVFAIGELFAQAPRTMSYQGMLRGSDGNAVPDGQYQISLSLYDSSNAVTPLFTQSENAVVIGGIVNVIIGASTPIPPTILFDRQYFLGITINSGTELLPHTALTSVPYALYSNVADGLTDNATIPQEFKRIPIVSTVHAVGDLWGDFPNPKVVKLRSNPITEFGPKSGDVLYFNGVTWSPFALDKSVYLDGTETTEFTIPQEGYYHFDATITGKLNQLAYGESKDITAKVTVGYAVDTKPRTSEDKVSILYKVMNSLGHPLPRAAYSYAATLFLQKDQKVKLTFNNLVGLDSLKATISAYRIN